MHCHAPRSVERVRKKLCLRFPESEPVLALRLPTSSRMVRSPGIACGGAGHRSNDAIPNRNAAPEARRFLPETRPHFSS